MKTIVTYKQSEIDLFEYIESKRSKSSFIKDLLERKFDRLGVNQCFDKRLFIQTLYAEYIKKMIYKLKI